MRSLLCLLLTLTASAADRPNIVVILADDYGYGSAGCYGAEIGRASCRERVSSPV